MFSTNSTTSGTTKQLLLGLHCLMSIARRYADRHILVTGASRGIGAAIAKRLGSEGGRITLTARSITDLLNVESEISQGGGTAQTLPSDGLNIVSLDQLVDSATKTFGPIDVLINNAGVLPTATRSERISLDDWERVLRLNLTAPWYLAGRCYQGMKGRGGVVVNVTSTAAFYPSIGLASYNASKAALTMLTKTLALEWAHEDVRVVGVAPGKIQTALVEPILKYTEQRGLKPNPLNRIGEPWEIAGLVAFVASDEASYLTGTVITFDGGEVAATGADLSR